MIKAKVVPSEASEQMMLVQWLEYSGYKYTAIPNHTWTPSQYQKTMNKRLGLRPGLPDILIVLKNKTLLFLEMKRKSGSTTTEYQKDWIATLNECKEVNAAIARGADEAIIKILEYENNPS